MKLSISTFFKLAILKVALLTALPCVGAQKPEPVEPPKVTVPAPSTKKLAPRADDDRPIYDRSKQNRARWLHYFVTGERMDCNFDG